jgi:hypothetical protein
MAQPAMISSTGSHQTPPSLALDDPEVVKQLRKYITTLMFAEPPGWCLRRCPALSEQITCCTLVLTKHGLVRC